MHVIVIADAIMKGLPEQEEKLLHSISKAAFGGGTQVLISLINYFTFRHTSHTNLWLIKIAQCPKLIADMKWPYLYSACKKAQIRVPEDL